MKQKIIVGTSAILLVSLFICAFTFLSDREHTSDGMIEESITVVPVEDATEDASFPSHDFHFETP